MLNIFFTCHSAFMFSFDVFLSARGKNYHSVEQISWKQLAKNLMRNWFIARLVICAGFYWDSLGFMEMSQLPKFLKKNKISSKLHHKLSQLQYQKHNGQPVHCRRIDWYRFDVYAARDFTLRNVLSIDMHNHLERRFFLPFTLFAS